VTVHVADYPPRLLVPYSHGVHAPDENLKSDLHCVHSLADDPLQSAQLDAQVFTHLFVPPILDMGDTH
jgi:hypothetical protein